MNAGDSQNSFGEPSASRNAPAAAGPLTTVGNYGTPQEAAIVQGILNDHGIPAFVHGGETATTMFYVGTALGGVSLQVPENFETEARRILAEKLPTDTIPAWKCPQCGADVDAGFEVCWQCSATRPDSSPTPGPAESLEEFPGDDIVNRAFLSAVFGILFCPLLFYALYLLGDARNAKRSDRSKTKLILAHVLAYVPIIGYLLLLLFLVVEIYSVDRLSTPSIELFPSDP